MLSVVDLFVQRIYVSRDSVSLWRSWLVGFPATLKEDATLDDNSTVLQHFSCQRINTSEIKEIGVSMSKINADHSEKSKRY